MRLGQVPFPGLPSFTANCCSSMIRQPNPASPPNPSHGLLLLLRSLLCFADQAGGGVVFAIHGGSVMAVIFEYCSMTGNSGSSDSQVCA